MDEDSKMHQEGLLLDPEERLGLLLGHLGAVKRDSPRGRLPAASSITVRTRSDAARAPAASPLESDDLIFGARS